MDPVFVPFTLRSPFRKTESDLPSLGHMEETGDGQEILLDGTLKLYPVKKVEKGKIILSFSTVQLMPSTIPTLSVGC